MRAPGWTRNAGLPGELPEELSRTGEALAAVSRPQAAHPQPLDSPGIGVQYLELDAVGMGDHLAALRHSAGQREDEPAQRIDRLLLPGGAQPGAMLLFERLNRDPRIGDDAAVRPLDQNRRNM